MITLNGNILCAIDVETTGTNPQHHEMTQVTFLPLTKDLEPSREFVPFDLLLHIDYEERIEWDALRVTKTDFMKHQQVAMDKYQAADLFEDWVAKFNLPIGKKIMPLAHNWPFDRGFIMEWLQPTAYDNFIDGRFRDSMVLAAAINDIYDRRNEPAPFTRINLSVLCKKLNVVNKSAHNSLADCEATAQVYKKLLDKRWLDAVK